MSSTINEGRDPIYDPALKILIAQEYLSSNLGYGKLAKKHDLKISSVVFFVRWYREHYDGLSRQNEPGESSKFNECQNPEQGGLREANLKIAGLQMLIENASKELGVDLVKKFGTRQSKR
jgi:transposase-like protein